MELSERCESLVDDVTSLYEQERKTMTESQKQRARDLISQLDKLTEELSEFENFCTNETPY